MAESCVMICRFVPPLGDSKGHWVSPQIVVSLHRSEWQIIPFILNCDTAIDGQAAISLMVAPRRLESHGKSGGKSQR